MQIKISPYVYPILRSEVRLEISHSPEYVKLLMDKVLSYYGLRLSDIKSKSRISEISECRQVICYILRNKTPLSLKQIGKAVGGQNYTTVIYSIKHISDLLETNKVFKKKYEQILKLI